MNRRCHRLVFSRRLGMRVAVAEHASAQRKSAGGASRAAVVALLVLPVAAAMAQTARAPVVFAGKLAAPKNNLPVANTNPGRSFVYDPAKGDPKKGGTSADLAGSGQVRWSVNGTTATFDQGKLERVVINWDSFDIGAGYKVHFAQDKDPTKYVSALNRIWSLDPSVILGSLTADREVILVNANGVYFGRGARVSTGSFVATANNIADAVFEKGLRNVIDGSAVFGTGAVGDYAATQLDAGVSVEAGAEIRSAAGGDVLLIAPRVVNQGRIVTANGQTVLAAGDKIYLMSSSDPAQRGLIVAVDPVKNADGSIDTTLGTVENAARGSYKTVDGATVDDNTPDTTSGLVQQLNEIRADSGSVNLVGLAVKQNGVINATTAVKGANGAIYLQAMASTQTIQSGRGDAASATGRLGLQVDANTALKIGFELGSVEFGAGSTTAVTPSTSLATQIDAEVFNPSRVRVEGKSIAVDAGALVQAAAGRIELLAANKLQLGEPIFDNTPSGLPVADDGSRIVIAPTATVSVAGLRDVAVDGARNQGSQRLFRIELADAPVQRDGPLYRSQVYFDLRDGSKIDAADVSGAAASIARTAAERSASGGTLRVETLGSLVVGDDATLDVSGGSLKVSEATLRNTLVQRNGTTMAFSNAAAGNRLDTVLANTAAKNAPAYTEGKSGGTLTLNGRNVAVAGDLRGSTIEGERQRDGSDARAAAAKLVFGRSVEGNYLLQSLQLAAALPVIDGALFTDPLTAAITLTPDSADLALATLRDSGFGAVSLNAAHVTQTGQGDLDLGTRGQLAITANSIALDGRYTAHGGSIALSTNNTANGAGDIVLSANTRLDVSGLWTNDSVAGQQAGAAAADIQVNGGTVSVAAARSALLAPGAAIDVSGGARLSASGALTQGTAGSISLATSRNIDVDGQLTLAGVSLRGHDFKTGGTLNIGAPQLTVSDSDSAAEGLTLAPAFFSAGGFGNIAVTAFGDIRFASGTVLQPQLLNWQLDADYRRAGSGTMTAAVASPTLLDTRLAERKPVNLSFVASRPLVAGDARQTGGALSVERGVRIALDPGARLTLAATDSLQVGASGGSAGQASELLAPGGNITLRIDGVRGVAPQTTGDATGYLPTQALWLGADAKLSVSGTAVLRPTSAATASTVDTGQAATPLDQRVTGTVYGGGSITLQANRGYVVAQAGSSLALDGAVANLNFAGIDSAVQVAKAAGTLTVSSPEGFALEGSISARAPTDSQGHALADGGRLDLAVGAGGVATNTESGRPYPGTVFDSNGTAIPGALAKPRELRLGGADTTLVGATAQPGDDVQVLLDNGIGRASQTLLTQSGFSGYRFASGDRVSFSDNLTLHAGLAIEFDTPVLSAAAGKQVSLTASYARLGDGVLQTAGRTPLDTSTTADTAAGHDSTLSIAAPTIELVGTSALQGFSTATLAAGAHGEIRLMGAALASQLSGSTLDTGRLNFAGTLNLQAAQVYSISGADFTFNGLAGDSRFVVRGSGDGSTPALPLSAFGALTVNATDIDQGGVLRQPFGAITLNASNSLHLGENSLTSVAADGASLLHGTTDNLSRWLLPSTGLAATQLPLAKGVTLNAAQISTASSARVDAKGGGDVLASEFFAGVGGSSDYLALDGLYAVLPDYATTRALASDGGRLAAASEGRELVVTMAGSGLAPGRYTLMPARLALLGGLLTQGAYIVSRASDQGKTVLASALRQDDGSSIVTGYFSTAGSITTGAPGERFVVEPLSTFSARSDNRLTSISTLLDSQSAGAGVRGTPRDGGRVQLSVTGTETSRWNAGISLAADGGAAGLLDISATRLALVDDLAKTAAGTLGVTAAVVNDSGAGSVLLGGLRSDSTATGTLVTTVDTTKTSAVTLDLGALALDVEELILASRDSITLAAGTTVRASRKATLGDRTLSTTGGGALAVVSANRLDVQRSAAVLGSGSVEVGAGSTLSGTQLAFDTAGSLAVDGSSQLSGQALALGARRLVVGNGAGTSDATASVVDAGLLEAARKTPELSLRSYSSIDFVGVQDWAARAGGNASVVARSLVLDSPVVRGVAAADGSAAAVDIAAQSIVLRNTTGQVPSAADSGNGTLTLQAAPPLRYGSTGGMALGPGELRLGFTQAELRSGGDIVLQGSGGTTAQGDLTLASARVTASTGANQRVQAEAGALRIETLAGSRTLGEHVGQGAQVSLVGTTLTQAGNIDLPGGALTLSASGVPGSSEAAVQLAAGSRTSVAGYVLPGHDGFEAHGLAGAVRVAAASGSIDIDGKIDVSAARRADGTRGSGDAGQVLLSATGSGGKVQVGGQIAGHAGSGAQDRGGSITVDVSTLASLDAIAGAAASGGLDHALTARVRSGDVAITAGVRAEQLRVSADAGQLSIGSVTLDAHADTGGVVQLSAGGNLSLAASAVIDARSTRAGANGGDVLLNSASGRVHLDTTASIDTRGDDAQDGRIVLRALRDGSSVRVDTLNTARLQGAEVDIEAVRVYSSVTSGSVTANITSINTGNSAVSGTGASGTGASASGTLGQTTLRNDNNSYMSAASGALAALGVTDTARVHLRAGVEVRAVNDLTIAADWALNADRPGGDAGFLTLRAGGNINVNGSLSDGFSSAASTAALLTGSPRAWSMRLAAGADFSAADPLAVRDLASASTETGNLTIAANKVVRTGAGAIELAAGRDIRFAGSGTAASGSAYVAGRRLEGEAALLGSLFADQAAKPTFTEQGGRLTLQAGRDITAPEATQLINNWFWRSGLVSSSVGEADLYNSASQLAWWSEFSRWRQTLGSMGGGDLTVAAGRNIENLQAMVPTSGWADDRNRLEAVVQVRNGGDLDVQAGGSVLGGQYFVGRGEGRLEAGASIAARSANSRVDAPILALMDGDWRLTARDTVAIAAAFNPTAMAAASTDNRAAQSGFFYSWSGNESLDLRTATGGVALLAGAGGGELGNYGLASDPRPLAAVLPSTLSATAGGGAIDLSGASALLFPSTQGQLALWAGTDIAMGNTGAAGRTLAMGDTSLTLWPDATRPLANAQLVSDLTGASGLITSSIAGNLASAALHQGDDTPVQLHAEGSLRNGTLRLAKAATLSAGQDLLDLSVLGLNLDVDDTTSIVVQRDLVQTLTGSLISIGGPGSLEVTAGRNLDLGASAGITTTGNVGAPTLPAQGANIRVEAATQGTLNLANFDAAYLDPQAGSANPRASANRDMLLAFVRDALQQPTLSYAQAWALFQQFPASAQAQLGRKVLAAEFAAVYLDSAASTTQMTESLRLAFERNKAQILLAGEQAVLDGTSITLPGREVLRGAALSAYLAELRALSFTQLDLDSTVQARVTALAAVRDGWRAQVAASLGSSATALDTLASTSPQDPQVLAFQAALADRSSRSFEAYRQQVLASEIASTGAVASQFGRKTLPMRLALFDQGFQAAELTGAGSFVAQPIWAGTPAAMAYNGTLDLTLSAVVSERGGNIDLVNAGGAINVGLKAPTGTSQSAKGVITLGGGDIFGYAKDDFQVNTQRVFVVGQGDMTIWSSRGDIDSGRGANTAVAAPPLQARRTADGIVFETPATTTGSGLGILEDTSGRRAGSIGLFPAFGEILALDAFIRAPSIVLGSTVRGADNIQSPSVGGAAAPVSAPPPTVAAPPSETRAADAATAQPGSEARPRNSLLTVELLGLGAGDETCSDADQRDRKCQRPPKCSDEQKAAGQCK